jgi:quinol monooxygenase YgiN
MIHVIADIEIKKDWVEEFLNIFKENVPKVMEEKGCIEYVPTVDVSTTIPVQNLNSTRVTVVEKWEDTDCLMNHFKAPHMLAYKEKVKDMVTNVSLKVLEEA